MKKATCLLLTKKDLLPAYYHIPSCDLDIHHFGAKAFKQMAKSDVTVLLNKNKSKGRVLACRF